MIEQLAGFRQNEGLRRLVEQVELRRAGSANFPARRGKVSLHVQVLAGAVQPQVNAIVPGCAGLLVWLRGAEALESVRAVMQRFEASGPPRRRRRAGGRRRTPTRPAPAARGPSRWRSSAHEPQSLLGLLRLLHPDARYGAPPTVPARPTVLLIDPQADRLRELGNRLAAAGYEVVPLADVDAGAPLRRRAGGGGDRGHPRGAGGVDRPSCDGEGRLARRRRADPGGARRRSAAAPADDALPEAALFLPVAGLEPPEIARRLLLVLLGRELGAAPDADLTSLVGDLAQTPLIELLRGLAAAAAIIKYNNNNR